MTYTIYVQRNLAKQPTRGRWIQTVDNLIEILLRAHDGWAVVERVDEDPYRAVEHPWVCRSRLTFECAVEDPHFPTEERWEAILRHIEAHGKTWHFASAHLFYYPPGEEQPGWDPDPAWVPAPVRPLHEIVLPVELLRADDATVEAHPSFTGLYRIGPQIRMVLRAMQSALESEFRCTNHIVIHGPPGVAKTHLLRNMRALLGEGGSLEFNGVSMTRAGIEQIFLHTYRDAYPRFVFVEEIDRASAENCKAWLSICDDRREIRRTNARGDASTKVEVLLIVTVNELRIFQRKLGTRLASRFQAVYVPRPDVNTLRRILRRDLQKYPHGDERWIQACLDLQAETGETDTRQVLRWLTGGNCLLTGEYQDDLRRIAAMEAADTAPRVKSRVGIEEILAAAADEPTEVSPNGFADS